MWIKNAEFTDVADHERRANKYRSHLKRVKRKFSPNIRFWIGEENLHDAKLTLFSFDRNSSTARFEFRCVGYWKGNPPRKPAARRLELTLSGVKELSFATPKNVPVSLANLTYIQGELNTDPALKPRGKLKSLALEFIGEEPFEMNATFEVAVLTEQKTRSPNRKA